MNRGSEYGLLLLLGLVCVAFGINSVFFGDTGNAPQRLQKPEAVGGRKGSFPPASAQGRSAKSATNAIPRALTLSPSPWAREAVELPEAIEESLLLDDPAVPAELVSLAEPPTKWEDLSVEDQLNALEGEMEHELLQQEVSESQRAEDLDPALPDAGAIPGELLALENEPDTPE
jgi:hypothetical protein